MDKEKTGKLIKEARMEKGYTQQELGDIVGVTNKAISRWENGETFPDVALLNELAYTLDLNIEEIVLGEKKTEQNHTVALEMTQLVRMGKNRKKRLIGYLCIIGMIFLLLLFGGVRILLHGLQKWSVQILWYVCILYVLILGCIGVRNNSLSASVKDKIDKVGVGISGLSVVYEILLVYGTLALFMNDINILGLKDAQIGPFINNQLLIIFLGNIIIALYLLLMVALREKEITMEIYLSATGIFLSMAYSDLLHRLANPNDFVYSYIIDTVVIVGIVMIGFGVAWIANKKKT